MQDIEIRKCNLTDLEKVFYLEKSVFGDEAYSYLILRQLYDVCGDLFRVAVTSKCEIAGYTIGCLKCHTLDAWILAMAVSPHYQRQGIGKQLISSIFNEFKNLEIKKVFLTVTSDNKIAINLYIGIGFSLISYENDYFGKGSSRNVMQKLLSY
jgi:ribosomal-protein-alanine N-acetyltransferase